MLNLDFSKKYEDNSCHKPYVQHIKKNGGKADIKIKKNAPAPFDYAAEFLGSNPQHHFNVGRICVLPINQNNTMFFS